MIPGIRKPPNTRRLAQAASKRTMLHAARVVMLLAVGMVGFACSEISLQSTLEGEQGGAFSLDVREVHLAASGEYTLSAKGGIKPYTFELGNRVGGLDAATGRYTAPDSFENGQVIDVPITATDYAGATDSALVRLYERLTVEPRNIEIQEGAEVDLSVSGGLPDYTFEFDFDEARLGWDEQPDGGPWILTYQAPDDIGEDSVVEESVRIYDSIGNRVTVEVIVYSSDTLRIDPSSRSVVLDVQESKMLNFSIQGGQQPYSEPQAEPEDFGDLFWTESESAFSFMVSSPGTAVITVTDDDENEATTKVTVTEEEPETLSLDPQNKPLSDGQSENFRASGGVPPYEFKVEPGSGHTLDVDGNVATFTFINVPTGLRGRSWEITVTDDRGESVSSTVQHVDN